ncbi:MAG: immunoglobulin-like domain-containing protein [Dehalobacterium sp.]|jgi:hypothetical protein
MKRLIMRKALAVLLAVVMIFGLIPFQALADDQPGDIKVYLKISHEDTTVLPPMELALDAFDVSQYGYGFTPKTGGPTVAHALIKGVEATLGGTFDKTGLDISASGLLKSIFGEENGAASYWMYAVNDMMSETEGIIDYVLEEGDEISVFFSDWQVGQYTMFDQSQAEIEVGQPLDLTLKGYSIMDAMFYGTFTKNPVAEAQVLADSIAPGHPDTPVAGKVTDAQGRVSLTFDQPGTYTLSAVKKMGETVMIVPPLCTVTVTAASTEEEMQKMLDSDWVALTLPDTAQGNLTLPEKGNSGKTMISWSSDKPHVISNEGKVAKQLTEEQVVLTATLTIGSLSAQKTFPVTVAAATEDELLADIEMAKSAMGSAAITLQEGVDENVITKVQEMVNSKVHGVTVTIAASSQPQINTDTGEVTYGSSAQNRKDVTFKLDRGGKTDTHTVKVTVPKGNQFVVNDDAAALDFNKIKGSNTSADAVTKDLARLNSASMTMGSSYMTTIAWESDHPAVISHEGKVTRPARGEADVQVIITATVTINSGPATPAVVQIPIKVLVMSDAEYDAAKAVVDSALNLITADRLKMMGESTTVSPENVTFDLQLFNDDSANKTATVWTSDKGAITVNTLRGKVTRPGIGEKDSAVTLTATISKDGYSNSKSIPVIVKAVTQAELDAESVYLNAVKEALTFDVIKKENQNATAVTTSLGMVYRGFYDSSTGNVSWQTSNSGYTGIEITWESTNSAVASYGTVTRPTAGSADVTGNMTATLRSIRLGAFVPSQSKEIPITVKAISDGKEKAQVVVSTEEAIPGSNILLPIEVKNIPEAVKLAGGEFTLTFDPEVALPTKVELGDLLQNFTLEYNMEKADQGTARVAFAGSTGVSEDGVLCLVTFQVTGKVGTSTPVEISDLILNDEAGAEFPATPEVGEIDVVSSVRYGDVNGDEDVTAGDAVLVLKNVVGLTDLDEIQKLSGDVNGDGEISAGDATLILRYVVELINKFPVEE